MSKQMTVKELADWLRDKNPNAPVYLMTEFQVSRYANRGRFVQVNAPVTDVTVSGEHIVMIGLELDPNTGRCE